MDNTLTIKQLISEGKEISQGIRHIPARPNSIRYEAEFQLADDAVYERWKIVTLRFLSTNYSDDISVSDFRNAMDEFEKKHYAPQKCENYFLIMPAARKVLVKPFFLDSITYSKQWQAQKFEPNKDTPLGNYFTTKDEHVRSKSEMIIANMLNTKGIPYHYEVPIKINSNLTFHPDFLCLNKRTRQEFYWEHCGMMDDSVYSGKCLQGQRQ